jgi:protein SCO1
VSRLSRVLTIGVAVSSIASMSGCGGEARELAGYQRDPAPVMSGFELPDLSNDDQPFAFRAQPGELLVVYFGYTNCPDFCPTTMSDVRFARQQLDDPDKISVAMVTIDPDRDLPILADYVSAFFPDDGHALGTDDQSLLTSVAEPFGTSFNVSTNDDGEIEVAHRTDLYAIDDQGRLVLTWPFGVSRDDLAADFRQLLEADT